jgi:hypothetical protein
LSDGRRNFFRPARFHRITMLDSPWYTAWLESAELVPDKVR